MTTTTTELQTILRADVESRKTADSCYVTIGAKVYDITDFLDDHPGGGDLILEYGGKDVSEIMRDEISHEHTEAAYEILDEHLVGYVATEPVMDTVTESNHPDSIVPLPPNQEGLKELKANGATEGLTGHAMNGKPMNGKPVNGKPVYATTGMSSEDDLSKETDLSADYRQHKFLDLNKPMFMQVWYGGFSKDFYLEQVHRPRHYKGGASAPLFGNFLEPLSKTPWWVVPTVWLPCISYGTWLAGQGLPIPALIAYWFTGLFLWTVVEYVLHRCLFHLDKYVVNFSTQRTLLTAIRYLPDNRVGITAHFLLHGIHHYLPMDKYRLVMPPTLFVVLATPFWKLAHTVFCWDWNVAVAVYCGGIFGYICYDMTHYFLHHRK